MYVCMYIKLTPCNSIGFLPSFLRAFPTNASAVFMFELVMRLLNPTTTTTTTDDEPL